MTKNNNNKKGAALIVVVMVFAVLMIIGTTALRVMSTETELAINSYDNTKAYYVAKSGADATANYIMENPDNINMGDFIESIDKQTSSNTKLDNTSNDYFNVTVTQSDDKESIEIKSTGTVNSESQATVTLNLSADDIGLSLDAAVYVSDYIEMRNNGTIEGDVVFTKSDTTTNIKTPPAEITGNTTTEVREFPMPDMPEMPAEITKTVYGSYHSTLQNNSYYADGLVFSSQTITINIGDDDFIIGTNGLEISRSDIIINKTGNGKLIIYVDGTNSDNEVVIDRSNFNADGLTDDVIIFCNTPDDKITGKNKKQTITESKFNITQSTVKSDLFVKAENFEISNKTTYLGQLFFDGSYIEVGQQTNKDSTDDVLIYAPDAIVDVGQLSELLGTVIAKEVIFGNNFTIESTEINESYVLDNYLDPEDYEKLPGKPTYKKVNYE